MSKRWLRGGSTFNRRGVELGNTGRLHPNCPTHKDRWRFKYTKIHAEWLDHQILEKLCWKYLRFPRPPIYIFKDYWIRIWPPPIQRFVSNMRGFRSLCIFKCDLSRKFTVVGIRHRLLSWAQCKRLWATFSFIHCSSDKMNVTHKALVTHASPIIAVLILWNWDQFQLKSTQQLKMIYFWKADGTRTSKTMFPSVCHPNTQIQIHKYILGQIWR